MTTRGWHRQQLLWTIRQWMRRNGAWFVFAATFLTVSVAAFAEETKTTQPVSLLKVLGEQKSQTVVPAPAKKEAVKKTATKKAEEVVKKKDEKTVEKTLKGTVTFIRKTKMSVEYPVGPDEVEEMYLSVDPKVALHRARTFSEVSQGDKVEVKYVQTYKDPLKKGDENIVVKNVVTDLTLLGKAKKPSELVSQEKDA